MLEQLTGYLILMLVGSIFRRGPYSRNWGYYPSGGLGLVISAMLILIILLLLGRIRSVMKAIVENGNTKVTGWEVGLQLRRPDFPV